MTDAPKDRFTLIFDGDIIDFEGNPFHVDTPFGRPQVVSVGDLAQEREQLIEDRTRLARDLMDEQMRYQRLATLAAKLIDHERLKGSESYNSAKHRHTLIELQNKLASQS